MTQTTNNYDRLYENMKQRFTVSEDNESYTLGEYMLKKAGGRTPSASLPVAVQTAVVKNETAVSSLVSFVNEKLTIKQPPVKDKTIRAFPFRASASAFLTASVACAFVLSFALVGARALSTSTTASEGYHQTSEAGEMMASAEVDFE
ncbi:MAG: hypothetical protein J6V80_00375 [Clostridia bacterium]|nr:hypothetical protein [Clostridia bacterium]